MFVCPPPVLYNEWEEVDESWQLDCNNIGKGKTLPSSVAGPEVTPELEGAETKSIPGSECAGTRENDCVTT